MALADGIREWYTREVLTARAIRLYLIEQYKHNNVDGGEGEQTNNNHDDVEVSKFFPVTLQ